MDKKRKTELRQQAKQVEYNPPIKLKMSNKLLQDFQMSEKPYRDEKLEIEGSKEGLTEEEIRPLTYEILDRYKTRVEIHNAAELMEIWFSLCSGTFKVHHTKAAQNLADKLLPYIKELEEQEQPYVETVRKQWTYPTYSRPR